MREILFRGKSLDDDAWVEGAFCMKDCDTPFGKLADRPSIIKYDPPCDGFWFRVDPETVGQFTGLTDKNGKKIFEGDKVLAYDLFGDTEGCGIVNWNNLFCAWHMGEKSMYGRISTYEVIGNIHDNPELLEVD